MIDIKLIRENKELVKENIRKKFKDEKLPIVDEVYDLDVQFRQAKKEADELRNEKNKLSDEIGSLMREGKKDEALLIKDKVSAMAQKIKELENIEESVEPKIRELMYKIPNIIDKSVPIGKDDSENVEIERFGEPTVPSFEIPYHADILENLKINYENIFSDDVSAGKYTTIIEFDDNHKIQVDTKSRYSAKDIYDNVQSIKNSYKDYLHEKKIEKIEKIKQIDLKEIMANHYSFNNFGKVADPNEYKTINKKSLFSTMYEKVLKGIDIDVAFVTIDELNKNRYKTTVMFPNGYSDYYYSNDLCSEETAIKNIENMRNSYIKMEQEIEQNEQDMEME